METKNHAGLFSRFFLESDTAMGILDENGFFIAVNRRFEALLASLSIPFPENAAAVPVTVRDVLGPRQASRFRVSVLRILDGRAGETGFETTLRLRGGGGVIRWFNIRAWLLENHESGPGKLRRSFIGLVADDRTQVRQEEKRLLEDKEIAEKAMEAKSQFLANMSHEIRTPIQTIIGVTELLQETFLDREQSEYSRQIKFSAEILLTLINDILDYSKIEAGKMEGERIDFDLEQCIEQAVEMISLEAHKKGLEIVTDVPLGLSLMIKGDPNKFRQVVINLVKNAVKFTKEGGVTVSAEPAGLDGKEAVRVSVADTGIGVSEEARGRLFTTFMQADASDTRRFGGTGLGLAISRNLVKLMKGRIEMVPNEGGGSVFSFTVPLERSGFGPPPLPNTGDVSEMPMLVVDDREISRKTICACLADLGCRRVEPAASGEEALGMMRAAAGRGNPYKLCFVDMSMPVMDGWRLAAEIHNDRSINGAHLILMAPHGFMGADTKMTLLKWFTEYINKPVTRRSLAATLNAMFREPAEVESIGEPETPAGAVPDLPVTEAVELRPVLSRDENRLPVLIAEDHPVNQKLFAMIIDKLGCRPVLADNGRDALEKVRLNPEIALILMDIQMPCMNGYEAARVLRQDGFEKPIIAVTASAFSDEREHCLSIGIDDILIKPFKRADIEKTLLKWIGGRGAVRPAAGPAAIPAIPVEGPDVIRAEGSNTPPFKAVTAEAAAASGAGVFNPAELLETFMGNDELACSLLCRFILRTAGQIEGIAGLKAAEDWESARREAHTIRGAAYTMTGKELGKAAARLEAAFKNRDRGEMETGYGLLAGAFGCFRAEAEGFLKSRNSVSASGAAG